MKLYAIKNWDDLYENSRSRVVKDLSWVPVPNKHDGENFSAIMVHAQGAKIFSGWILILQIASKCKERGILKRDNGHPHTPETMAIKTRAPKEWFELALAYLCENTDWLDVSEVECHLPVTCPSLARHPSAEEGKGIEGNEQKETPPASRLVSEIDGFEGTRQEVLEHDAGLIYDAYPRKEARKDAIRAIIKAFKQVDATRLLELTRAYTIARQGQDPQFTPHPATWFNGERYKEPDSWKPPMKQKYVSVI
jgi:hypothetical protein